MENMRRKLFSVVMAATVTAATINAVQPAAVAAPAGSDESPGAGDAGLTALSVENETPDFWDMLWGLAGQWNIALSGPGADQGSQQLSDATSSSGPAKLSAEGSVEGAALGSFGAFGDNRLISRAVLSLAGIAAVAGAVAAGTIAWATLRR
ncbi:hypothetical protein HMPREF3098_07790 [Corynebacterium sp. HMSC28B08]|nr:hypothetical protein HMPREF3098_07790 [Corynebacterium sp. HMSC28B08]